MSLLRICSTSSIISKTEDIWFCDKFSWWSVVFSLYTSLVDTDRSRTAIVVYGSDGIETRLARKRESSVVVLLISLQCVMMIWMNKSLMAVVVILCRLVVKLGSVVQCVVTLKIVTGQGGLIDLT